MNSQNNFTDIVQGIDELDSEIDVEAAIEFTQKLLVPDLTYLEYKQLKEELVTDDFHLENKISDSFRNDQFYNRSYSRIMNRIETIPQKEEDDFF